MHIATLPLRGAIPKFCAPVAVNYVTSLMETTYIHVHEVITPHMRMASIDDVITALLMTY